MRIVRNAGITLITVAMSLGLLGMTANVANADTGWGGAKIKVVSIK